MIEIVYAASWISRRRFYSFPHLLYKRCEEWREPEVWGGRKILSARHNPLLAHPHAFLMAEKHGRTVARMLTGCINGRGYFAMFDAEDDEEAVGMLVAEAASWQRRHCVKTMIGPIAPHPLDLGGGVLTEGFDERAAFGDAYNAPYYDRLLTNAGMEACEEQLAYSVNVRQFELEKYERAAEWAKERFGYKVLEGLTDKPRELNEAVCRVMGHEADWEGMARSIEAVRPYLLKEMCPVICVGGQPVGYLLTIRGQYGRDGRTRIATMWVHEKWRKKGAIALLFAEAARAMDRLGIEEADASWVRADNDASRRSIENAGGRVIHRYKRYLIEI